MKGIIVVFALIVSAFAVINPIYNEWEKWKSEYNPHYLSNEEHDKRFQIFAENKQKVLELNRKYANEPDGPRFGLNQFADLTSDEFANLYLHQIPSDIPRGYAFHASEKDYPKKKDWREEGAVNPVKSQDSCSCWPYSATSVMESVYKIANGKLPLLSIQQLIDCDKECMMFKGQLRCDNGCVSGLVPNAFNYAVRNGMTTNSEYPPGTSGTCKFNNHTGSVYHFKKWFFVGSEESQMVAALNDVGPLAVGVDATAWQLYTGGIFNLECGTTMNHFAVIVGYDSSIIDKKEVKYWIIENSWGKIWGEKGYIRLARGMNECAVNDFVSTIVA